MKRTWLLALAVAACDPGAAVPAEPAPTRLLLTVTYNDTTVDELRVTGTALTQNRSFGPFQTQGITVRSGATIGLLFDPSDDGFANVCVEGRAAGAIAVSACADFPVKANELSKGTLALMGSSGDACSRLEPCCHELDTPAEIACLDIVHRRDQAACGTKLGQLKQSGICY